MVRHIAIFSVAGDLHALAIQQALASDPDITCSFVATNAICDSRRFSWSVSGGAAAGATLPRTDGSSLAVADIDLAWWRRVEFPQQTPAYLSDPAHLDLIANDCSAALLGALLTDFRGRWVSDPTATRLAENKLVQLRAARRAGFRVPDTLVSQDPAAIRRFCAAHDNRVILKPVKGTHQAHLLTQMVSDELLASDESMGLCPAIYQEYIPGTRHIRAQCFGDAVYAAQIEAEALDWRADLDLPAAVVELDDEVRARLRRVVHDLGLRMGIVDLKLTDQGEIVWIEVNPQGQFLFVEGMTGLDLTSAFVDFLRAELAR